MSRISLLRYLEGFPCFKVTFSIKGNNDGLIGFIDMSYPDNPDRKSTKGYSFYFSGTPIA